MINMAVKDENLENLQQMRQIYSMLCTVDCILLQNTCFFSSPLKQKAVYTHTNSIIKFALSVGHGNSDERSLTGNKRANERGGGGQNKGPLVNESTQSLLQSRWL